MKLAIGLGIQDSLPGEAFPAHVGTILEGWNLVNKPGDDKNLVLITPFDACPHDKMRWIVAEQAIEKGCDRLFFMDDDTITPRGGLTELMRVMDTDERKPVAVSGFYLRRGDPYTPVWSCKKDSDWYQVTAEGGVHEIDMTGLGCCLLDLKWMEKNLPHPWFRMKQDDHCTLITDDTTLFEGIRKADGKILGNAFVQCAHVGRRELITMESHNAYRAVAGVHKSRMAQLREAGGEDLK
jgi:hypothetical protein